MKSVKILGTMIQYMADITTPKNKNNINQT
jgi:hypothetical protein